LTAERVKVVERRLPEFLGAVEKHLSQVADVTCAITLAHFSGAGSA
jgi:hypothetical protein